MRARSLTYARSQRQRVIRKRLRLAKALGYEIDAPGRFSKRPPFGCSTPKCSVCHGGVKPALYRAKERLDWRDNLIEWEEVNLGFDSGDG
jgi:hypothetical protein